MQLQLMDLIDIARTKGDYGVNFKKFNFAEMYNGLKPEYKEYFNSTIQLEEYFENEISFIDSGDEYDNMISFSPVKELLNRNKITFTFESLCSMFFDFDEEEPDNLFEQRPEDGDGILVFEHGNSYFLGGIYNILRGNGANVELQDTAVIMDNAWEEQELKFYYLEITGDDAMKLPATLKQTAITITAEGNYVFVEVADSSTGYYDPYYMNSLQRPIMQIVLELCKNDSWVIETDEKFYNQEFTGDWSKIHKKLIHMFGNTKEVIF